jgi:YVTN family beta-propeller protein
MKRLAAWLFVLLGGASVALVAGTPVARAAGAVLVMNSASASLSVLDMATRTETRRIPVLREPHHWAMTPDGRDLLVGDTVGNELLVFDPVTFALRRRLTVADPYQFGFSPDGKYLVVNGLARAQIDVYAAGTYALVHRFKIKSMPSHLDFAPDSSVVYISLQGTGRLVAIDLRDMKVIWDQPVGPAPAGVLYQNGQVLVADMGADYVAVMDPKDGHEIRRIRTGKGAHQLFRSPDRKLIYVNNRIDSTIVVLDAASLKEVRSYKLPGGPDDIQFAPNGDIWVTMRFAHKVAVLDPRTGDYTTIETGRSPHGIFLNPRAVAGP